MKFKLPISVCVIISLALVLFGLLFGVINGYNGERQEVVDLLTGENGLMDVFSYRGADGLNLCVVARRHLPQDDADVVALETAARALRTGGETLMSKKAEDENLDAAVAAVAAKLRETTSFAQSDRDQKYLDMLTADLQNLAASATTSAYNQAAQEFNQQLDTPVLGDLAKLLGITPCELYQ